MTKQELASIGLAFAILTQVVGCSKTTVNVGDENPQRFMPASPRIPALAPGQTVTQRIVEIDRLLAAPLTGKAGDSDQRVALRAERDALTGQSTSVPAARVNQATSSATTVTYRVPAVPVSQGIVVARDSQAEEGARRISPLEQMTKSERDNYYRYLKLTNPNPVVPVVVRSPRR